MSKCQAQKIQIPRDSDLLQFYGQLRNKPILHLSALSSKSYLHSLWDQILSWEQLYLRTFQLWAWILALVLSNTWDSVNIQTTKINTSLQAKVKAMSQVQRTSPRNQGTQGTILIIKNCRVMQSLFAYPKEPTLINYLQNQTRKRECHAKLSCLTLLTHI